MRRTNRTDAARTRRAVLRTATGCGLAALAAPVTARTGEEYGLVHVPDDEPTIQDGADAAERGDLVLVESGTYAEAVDVSTPGITIRGVDRNEVVLDGEFGRSDAVLVEVDGVAVENLTARHYERNAFDWHSVEGFRGSYLTAYNNGYYGLYAYRARDGRFEHSYASGHPDAGFYLGRNDPFEAVVSNVVAEHNAVGYSGTSAGGDLTIEDSTWRHNMAGIVPNTLDGSDPPQRSCRIVGNEVYENDAATAPATGLYPTLGMGIVVWGGHDNRIEDNEVRDHDLFGIVLEPNVVEPSGNEVRGNDVSGSGVADLALGAPAAADNEFVDNAFERSLPPEVESGADGGDERVSEAFDELRRRFDDDELTGGDWRDQPEPGERPTMPDPEAPPRPAGKEASWDDPG